MFELYLNIFNITDCSSNSGCLIIQFLAVLIMDFNDLKSKAWLNEFESPSLHNLYKSDIFFDKV